MMTTNTKNELVLDIRYNINDLTTVIEQIKRDEGQSAIRGLRCVIEQLTNIKKSIARHTKD